jgi:MoxR-like ATPase
MDLSEASEQCGAILDEVAKAVVTDRERLETVLLGVLARGHVLIEDVPGTGKTLTARTVASVLGLEFSRIQFTPDLLPGDVTGTNVYDERERTFSFQEGPIFANLVLADEINRAPPKTQAALLEAMEEGQVTVDGETRDLPDPFFVVATQNPIEQEGTFQLPEAQVDRFAIKTSFGYPSADGEAEILFRRTERRTRSPGADQVVTPEQVEALRTAPEAVHVDDDLVRYVVRLARATREDDRVETGVSPRGTQRLLEVARATAALAGREFVTPDDVKRVVHPVLAHRLVLTPNAKVNEVAKPDVIDDVTAQVTVPTVD